VRDILDASEVCRVWHATITTDALLWKKVCQAYYLDTGKDDGSAEKDTFEPNDASHFFETYKGFHQGHAGGFIDLYLEQRPVFERLKLFLAEKVPKTLDFLAPGTNISSVCKRKIFGKQMTLDNPQLRCLLLWASFFDGQMVEPPSLGVMRYSVLGAFLDNNGLPHSLTIFPAGTEGNMRTGEYLLCFWASGMIAADRIALVLAAPDGKRHLVNRFIHISPDFDLDSFTGCYIDRGYPLDFWQSYVSDLESGKFDTSHGYISSFPESGRGTASSTSHGIRAHISTLFRLDDDPHGRHAFRLRLEWTPECPYTTVQLRARWWTFAYHSRRIDMDPGLEIGGLPILSRDNPTWEAVSYAVGIEPPDDDTEFESPRAFPEGDPVVWMAGKLDLVPGSITAPLFGTEEFSMSLKWYLNWPRWIDPDADEEQFDEETRAVSGVEDDYWEGDEAGWATDDDGGGAE
jgi:hypothetical protein